MSTVLVVGGAGYIGAHLVRRLCDAGRRVVVFDDLSTGHAEAVAGVPLVRGSLAERGRVAATLKQHGVDAVFHLATRQDHPGTAPTERWREMTSAMHLLEAMKESGVRALVCTAPGHAGAENGVLECLLDREREDRRVAVTLVHLPIIVGADAGALGGDRRIGGASWLRCALQVASGARPAQPLPSGDAVQEYLHVADACDGIQRAFEHARGDSPLEQWFLGSGCHATAREVVAAVTALTGRSLALETSAAPVGDLRLPAPAVVRARRVLGWKPACVTLRDLVAAAWRWERTRHFLERQREREAMSAANAICRLDANV